MPLSKQILIALVLLLAIGAGAFWHVHNDPEGVAEAAGRRGPEAVPIEIMQAERGTVRERIEAVGTTLARQAVDIVPLTSGRVVEFAISPGQRVETGQLLVRLDDEAERAAVAEAEAALREAELARERARKLRVKNTVSQATVDELEAAYLGAEARLNGVRKQLADRTVRAPFSGVVGIRQVDVGARVDEDTVLTTLDDLAEVEIQFSVPEIFFGQVRQGQPVTARSAAFPGREFTGRIGVIDTRIGEISRAFRVRAVLPNPDLALPAGMFMHVEVVLAERPAVLVPEEAVVAVGEATYVFTVQDERARRLPVRLGQRRAGTVEVLDGIGPGELVVQRGLQRLRDGALVRIEGAGDESPDASRGEGV